MNTQNSLENILVTECICKVCGIPFIIKSINSNNKLVLSCPNYLHNNFIKELSPIEYDQISYKINCKCMQCNKYRNNPNEAFYYCFKCYQIFCSQCIVAHNNIHPNLIVIYDAIKNKCLRHMNKEYKLFCFNCNDFFCEMCLNDHQGHDVAHQVDLISNLNTKNQMIIQNLKNENENYLKLLEYEKENIEINDYLINNIDKVYNLISQKQNCNAILSGNSVNNNFDYKMNNNYLSSNQINSNNNNNSNNFNQNNLNYQNNNQINNNQNNNICNNPNYLNDINQNNNQINNNQNNNICNNPNYLNDNNQNNILKTNPTKNNNQNNNNEKNLYYISNNQNINISQNNDPNTLMRSTTLFIYNTMHILQPSNVEFIINAVYLDSNMSRNPVDVLSSFQTFQQNLNGTLIFLNDKTSFELFVKYVNNKKIETNQKYKFVLIMNGFIANQIMPLINNNNEILTLFPRGILYVGEKGKYKNIIDQYQNILEDDFTDDNEVTNYLKQQRKNELYKDNTAYPLEGLINYDSYKAKYYALHQIISSYYGDDSVGSYNKAVDNLMSAFGNVAYDKKLKLKSLFEVYSQIKTKDYECVLKEFIKKEELYDYINKWTKSLDSKTYQSISYFIGNLMYSLYQYGKISKKGADDDLELYAAFEMNVVEVMNLLSNQNSLITFPYFVFCDEEKEKIENKISKLNKEDRLNSGKYSVFCTLKYEYKDELDSNIFIIGNILNSLDLSDNEGVLILPFTFYKLDSAKINSDNLTMSVKLTIIGRKEEAEVKVKKGGKLIYDEQKKYMK